VSANKKRVLSGIQPSGGIHLGNYLGAIQNWVNTQDQYDNIFCVVDLHAITVPQDPKTLRSNIRELATLLYACGLDQEKSPLFVQSDVRQHAELTWILNCSTPMGWLNRMTQFKEKSENQTQNYRNQSRRGAYASVHLKCNPLPVSVRPAGQTYQSPTSWD